MSPQRNTRPAAPDDTPAGVLQSLPRHRPGRASGRRAGARAAAAQRTAAIRPQQAKPAQDGGEVQATPSTAKPRATRSNARPRASTARSGPSVPPVRPAVPAQGFAIDEELTLGRVVEPPTTRQMLGSAVSSAGEATVELTRLGISLGEALLRRGGRSLRG
ncbi:MAG: hypothetical protein ACYDA6_00695 [Solirubrobacteraceae bacterium]